MATQLVHKSGVEPDSALTSYLQLAFLSSSTSGKVNMYNPRAPRSTNTSDPSMVCVDCFQAKGNSELRIPCQNPNCRFYLQTPITTSAVALASRKASVSEVGFDPGWSLFGPGSDQHTSTDHLATTKYTSPQFTLPVSPSGNIWGYPASGLLYSSSARVNDAAQKKRSQSICFEKEDIPEKIQSSRLIRSRLVSLPAPQALELAECGDLVEDAFTSSPLFKGEEVKPQSLTPDKGLDSGISSPYSWSDLPKVTMISNTASTTVVSQSEGGCFDMNLLKAEINTAASSCYRTPAESTTAESSYGIGTLKKFLISGGFSSLLTSNETYSRKVFVGGLPTDIDDEDIKSIFVQFGSLTVDWPHKLQTKACVPPKGYAFLLFKEELSVLNLLHSCFSEDDKYFIFIPTNAMTKKKVQVRPWCVSDSLWYTEPLAALNSRKAVFVGGVPRPLKANELARVMKDKYGSIVLVVIDCDSDLKYPKGAACVVFSSHASYIAAVSARFMQLNYGSLDKKVEIKPYVLDGQMCDECHGVQCSGKPAPFFCGNVACLQYFCEYCWASVHSMPGRQNHRPLQKDIGDKARYY